MAWQEKATPTLQALEVSGKEPAGIQVRILAERPPVDAAMQLVLDAWRDLDSCRPLSERYSGSIPYTALLAWAEVEGLDYDEFTMLKDVIRRLDADRFDRIVHRLKKPPAKGPRR